MVPNESPIRISTWTRLVAQAEGERIGEIALHELDDENLAQLNLVTSALLQERALASRGGGCRRDHSTRPLL